MCKCVSVCHMHSSGQGGQKRVLQLLELELQAVLRHLVWMLGGKQGSSVGESGTPNH